MKKLGFLIGLGALAVASSLHAAIITYDMAIEFSGATAPAGAGPWMRFTIADTAPDTVSVKIDNIGLVGTEFVSGAYLNLNPALNPASLNFSLPVQVGSFALPSIDKAVNAYKADGDGFFDIRFNFANANSQRFGVGESVTYTVTGISGLNATDFDFLSVNGPPDKNGFPAAAHVLSIGLDGEDSGWVTVVPEPASMSLLALGMLPLLRRRRV